MKITYTNPAGNSLELKSWPPRGEEYILQEWEGFGEIPVAIQTQKAPFQDGETLIGQLLEPRDMTIQFVIHGENRQEVFNLRRTVQNIFNPKLGAGTLQWEQNDGTTYEIECIPDGSPQFPGGQAQSNIHQTVIVNLRAPGAVWEDIETGELELASIVSLFSFPLSFPTRMGVVADERTIENNGDISCPVYIEFNGPAENPVVTNETTGEFIKVEQELAEGEKLKINTAFGKKTVVLEDEAGNEENAFGYIDLESTFWQLEVGENTISYTADTGADEATVLLYYKQLYTGV